MPIEGATVKGGELPPGSDLKPKSTVTSVNKEGTPPNITTTVTMSAAAVAGAAGEEHSFKVGYPSLGDFEPMGQIRNKYSGQTLLKE